MSDSDIRSNDALAHLRRLTVPLKEEGENWEPAYVCAVARDGVAEIERLRSEVERLTRELSEARALLRKCVTEGYSRSEINAFLGGQIPAIETEESQDDEDRYDCPIHGLQEGPDCPRC